MFPYLDKTCTIYTYMITVLIGTYIIYLSHHHSHITSQNIVENMNIIININNSRYQYGQHYHQKEQHSAQRIPREQNW